MLYEVDLHMHTSASKDGDIPPEAIIDMALEAGMKAIAITDHNTCEGSIQAQEYIKREGIKDLKLISGIEMDCLYKGINLHILGYGIDRRREEFAKFSRFMDDGEREASFHMKDKIATALGIKFDLANLKRRAGGKVITGEVMAEELLENAKYNGIEQLMPYREGGERADNPYVNFYWDYCAQGQVGFIPIEMISLDEAVKMITNAGGIAVLAHPGNNIHEDEELLQGIMATGVVGIEAISSYHTREQVGFYMRKVQELRVMLTCGSDFHGKIKPAIKIGEFDYDFDVVSISIT